MHLYKGLLLIIEVELYLKLSAMMTFVSIAVQLTCDPTPCLHGGTCITNEAQGYTCTCAAGYTGRNCEKGKNKQPRRNKKLIFLSNSVIFCIIISFSCILTLILFFNLISCSLMQF